MNIANDSFDYYFSASIRAKIVDSPKTDNELTVDERVYERMIKKLFLMRVESLLNSHFANPCNILLIPNSPSFSPNTLHYCIIEAINFFQLG